jgi:Ca2+-binding EF-hand superfamily protein
VHAHFARQVFTLFDPDGDGVISIEELQHGLAGLHLDVSRAEIQQMMDQFDADSSGMLSYEEFTSWLLGKRRDRKRDQMADLQKRLTTFAQGGSGCQLRRTPRVWSGMLTTKIEKRLIDNIGLVEKKLQEKEAARDPPVPGFVTSTQLWRVLLEQLGLKISTDHFTHFIQRLQRQMVDGVELIEYQPFVAYFRKLDARRRRERKVKAKVHDRCRRKTVRSVLKMPPPTRHDAVATAVVEAITAASWGGKLDSEIKKQRTRAMAYYMDDPDIQKMEETLRPTFQQWLEQPSDRRRAMARKAMDQVAEYESQAKESGTHAIMLAFKASDRDAEGNTGVTGAISPEAFKAVIREICGTRMQGWNDFEGLYNVSPRQLDFCVEIAEKVPSRTPVWQYRDNQGKWRNYEPADCKAIEEAKRDGKALVRRQIRGRLYECNMDRLEQMLVSRRTDVRGLEDGERGRTRDMRSSGEPNKHAGMIRYGSFFARLAKASARATFENFRRAGGAQRREELGSLESETRKLLGGVTFELQQALADKMQSMGGEDAMRIAFERFDEDKDGHISQSEFQTGLMEMEIKVNGKRIGKDQIDKIIEVLDQDGDGQLRCVSTSLAGFRYDRCT